MAYSERAKAVRRCKATRRNGQPCRAYAKFWTELCAGHTYKRRGKAPEAHRYNGMRTKMRRRVAVSPMHGPTDRAVGCVDGLTHLSTVPSFQREHIAIYAATNNATGRC
jgi:hypothetical protein